MEDGAFPEPAAARIRDHGAAVEAWTAPPPMRLSALLCFLALAGCEVPLGGGPAEVRAPADSASAAIPFTLAGPGGAALVVPVSINGGPEVPFVLDTGATLTCLDAARADSLDLPRRPGVSGFGAGVGGSGTVGIVQADSFRVGNATAYDLSICTIDLSAIEGVGLEAQGLVGLNFLKSFRVGLDFEAETLTLEAP